MAKVRDKPGLLGGARVLLALLPQQSLVLLGGRSEGDSLPIGRDLGHLGRGGVCLPRLIRGLLGPVEVSFAALPNLNVKAGVLFGPSPTGVPTPLTIQSVGPRPAD